MKNITNFLLLAFLVTLSFNAFAFGPNGGQSACTNYYITSNAGWSTSEYYKIIDIDAGTLTNPALPQFTAADGAKNALNTDFKSGYFTSPVLTTTDGTVYTPTSVVWPINYYLAAFAPTMYTSAWTKMNVIGSNPSGSAVACTFNDNSIFQSAIFAKPGFIELSRQGSAVLKTPPSLHGYIEIDSLPQVERIKWSYSATSYKRGVKMDLNYNDGKGWIPQRWIASDYNNFEGTFSEQGYQFEEMVGKQDDPTSYVSLRIRIWDGDSIHMKVNANDLLEQAVPYSATMTPYDQKQTVRVHQIQVFSNIIPTKAPSPMVLSAVRSISANSIKILITNKNIVLSETANVELYSIDGKTLYKGITNKVDVSNYSKGVYIIRAIDADGRLQNKKIAI
jgi:hypothetical protein